MRRRSSMHGTILRIIHTAHIFVTTWEVGFYFFCFFQRLIHPIQGLINGDFLKRCTMYASCVGDIRFISNFKCTSAEFSVGIEARARDISNHVAFSVRKEKWNITRRLIPSLQMSVTVHNF